MNSLVINGWTIYVHPLLLAQVEAFRQGKAASSEGERINAFLGAENANVVVVARHVMPPGFCTPYAVNAGCARGAT